MQTTVRNAGAGHFRRYHGYDYSRGAALFLTISLDPKRSILGRVDPGGVLVLNEWGRAVERTLFETAAAMPEIVLHRHVVMPNHVHLRIYLRPGLPQPLKTLGSFIRHFKLSSRSALAAFGHEGPLWQEGYHDVLCLSREMFEAADLYIENNPRKWWLLMAPDRPMRVVEPICHGRLDAATWWAGVGETSLLERRIAAFRLSRRLDAAQGHTAIECALRAADQGWVVASTFVSPCERELLAALSRQPGACALRLGHKELGGVYRPAGHETALFAEGRLLLLSRQTDPAASARAGWLGLNADAVAISDKAVYARPGQGGALLW